MTIAILAKPITPKAAELPQTADAGTSATAGDFAALLGRMATGAGIPEVPPQLALDKDTAEDNTAGQPQDAALLLAAMGLGALRNLDSAQTGAEVAAELPGNAGAEHPTEVTLLTAQNGAGKDLLGAAETDRKSAADSLFGHLNQETQASEDGTGLPALAAGVDEASPAKLAGFEQKLADSLAANREPAPLAPQALAVPGHTVHTPHTDTQHLHIDTPVREQAWPAEFGQKLVWMASQDKQSAQITLNPPQLGPIEISLDLKSDVATAVFASTNADVREAIETAIPRLREMLAGVGVELGQANVSAESFRQSNTNGNEDRNGSGGGERGGNNSRGGTASMQSGAERMVAARRGNGLVDTFA